MRGSDASGPGVRPPNTSIVSASCCAARMSCVMSRIVTPWLCNVRMMACTRATPASSSDAVGSSMTSTRGRQASTPGDCGKPLLSSAERERVPVGEVGYADEVERLLHAFAHSGVVEPLVAWAIGHVVAHGGGEQLPFGALHDQTERTAQCFALAPFGMAASAARRCIGCPHRGR